MESDNHGFHMQVRGQDPWERLAHANEVAVDEQNIPKSIPDAKFKLTPDMVERDRTLYVEVYKELGQGAVANAAA